MVLVCLALGDGLSPVVLLDRQHVVWSIVAGADGDGQIGDVGARRLRTGVVERDLLVVDILDVVLEPLDQRVVGGIGPVANIDFAFLGDRGLDIVERHLRADDRHHHRTARGRRRGRILSERWHRQHRLDRGSREPERDARSNDLTAGVSALVASDGKFLDQLLSLDMTTITPSVRTAQRALCTELIVGKSVLTLLPSGCDCQAVAPAACRALRPAESSSSAGCRPAPPTAADRDTARAPARRHRSRSRR